jgi:hypothetical protein
MAMPIDALEAFQALSDLAEAITGDRDLLRKPGL